MEKPRFFSFMIVIATVAFIIYIVVDHFSVEQSTQEHEFLSDAKESEPSTEQKDVIGLFRGQYAPDFKLPLWDTNEERSLSSFRGQIIVLNLWASWCPPCREEMPDLIELNNNYQGKGVQVVGINMATLERNEGAIEQFMVEYNVTFPTFVDQPIDSINQRGVVETLYKVRAIPATFILDEEGQIFSGIRGKVNYEMLENEILNLMNR